MGLITKTVKMKWNPRNKKYYESLGYFYTKIGDEFELKIDDLAKGSNIKVDCKCDGCGKNLLWLYNDYNNLVKNDGSTYCQSCGTNLTKKENTFSKSFYDWCVENNRQDILDRWDYGLNQCSPKDIGYRNGKKYYFKCNIHSEHKSELKNIANFTGGSEGSIACNQCNSFYQWCIDRGRQDVLNRWDYELNQCSPKDIPSGTKKKYYFKCNMHPEHKSELKLINSFTNGQEGSITCNQCNSIAQYILDNFQGKDLYDVWDKDKNKELNPWDISRGSGKKIWVICQEKDYHDSYEIDCSHFIVGVRCPYCVSRKVHPKDSIGQYIVDKYGEEFLHKIWSDKNNKTSFEYGLRSNKKVWWKCLDGMHKEYLRSCDSSFAYDFRCPECVKERKESTIEEKTRLYLEELGYNTIHEHDCTIRPINPKTKMPMPYDNEIVLEGEKHLIIEVHGGQHYDYRFYKIKATTEEEANKLFRYQQVKDRYKKAYAEHYGYYYLELPYWAFRGKNKNLYKQMIDDKIEEILHNTKVS